MSVPLQNADPMALECITLALGWDPAPEPEVDVEAMLPVAARIDLNIAALLFGGDRLLDVVYHEHLSSQDGSIRHTSDNLTGEGRGDSETIVAALGRISPAVTSVITIVTSYTAMPFEGIENAYCRIDDAESLIQIARFALTGGPHTALVVGKLARTPAGWEFIGIGAGIPATHVAEAVPYLAPYLP
ncbi:TerD family protein [Nocardia sp. NPDC088792]|uniref:TerD family protein n=1 Tax=Nocardia sp. NPDC088792 TaxID=3364332 RepID=UPI0038289F0F